MRKPLSPETKYKIKLFTVYLSAIIFCIFWLSAEVEITRRVKLDRIMSEELLSAVGSYLSDYGESRDVECLERAGEKLLQFYSLAKRNSEARSVLITFRRGYPKFTQKEISDIGGIGSALLSGGEGLDEYIPQIIKAAEMIKNSVSSKSKAISSEASGILRDIVAGAFESGGE